jgi:hypothetical protein
MLADFIVANVHFGVPVEQELRKLVGSDDFARKLQNRNFVALHYYGFLRREPDEGGLASWTDLLNRRGDPMLVTTGIITSVEYRQRVDLIQLKRVALDSRLSESLEPAPGSESLEPAPADIAKAHSLVRSVLFHK